ncbi:MAG TPA: hypothetical protein VII17_04320, partial [Steroidobacteraceae bacterium]
MRKTAILAKSPHSDQRAKMLKSRTARTSRFQVAHAAMPALSPSAVLARRDLAWRVIGLVNLYRLLLPPVLLGLQWLAGQATVLTPFPALFQSTLIVYFSAGVLLVIARRLSWASVRGVALVNAGVDAIGISLILYASGGVTSGLGILLVLPVVAMAVLAEQRDAFL